MKKFRVSLIGCGTVSENHLSALCSNDKTEIVALCDIHEEKAVSRAKEFGLERAVIYTDYQKMLDEVKPDAVHICTPHYLHAQMAIYALKRNINVFLEKPMCINEEEIKSLLNAEKESSAKITVCFQNRFNPSTIIAKRIADEDGGVVSAYGTVIWERNVPYYTGSEWRGRYATEGGGVMINQAIHTIDLLCYFLGTPEHLFATTANHHLKGIVEVEDTCEGLIFFESGKRADFYTTTSFVGHDSTEVFLLTKNHKIEIKTPYLYVDGEKYEDLSITSDFVGKECYGNGHKHLIEKFYDALLSGAPMPVTLESAQYAVRILLAAYKSHDEKTDI